MKNTVGVGGEFARPAKGNPSHHFIHHGEISGGSSLTLDYSSWYGRCCWRNSVV